LEPQELWDRIGGHQIGMVKKLLLFMSLDVRSIETPIGLCDACCEYAEHFIYYRRGERLATVLRMR